jgi:sugar transferase (PEP-CTERM/EpsH1 system associated)
MMQDLLFISHRIPFPPDKGEKIRGLNLLKHLSKSYRIHLGCLMDNPEDPGHLETLREWCVDVAGFPIDKRRQKYLALLRARPGRPLMLDYYRHAGLQAWVDQTMARTRMDVVYIYSVAMMPYVEGLKRHGLVLDAQDIDSEKWTSYAETAGFPMKLVWAREGRTLLAYERQAAMKCDATLFVSPQEVARFAELAPESAAKVHAVENGVDLLRFNPDNAYDSPFDDRLGPHLVFTGNMDYWPNADAVIWFATAVMPRLRAARPAMEFHIVGANPGPAVLALNNQPGIHVTGRVPDVRPYVAHADVAVAPLRIARGIQNKVLEAMAMARPVVASPGAFEGVRATAGRDVLVADGAGPMADAILSVLNGEHPGLAAAGRQAVEAAYAWSATLSRLDAILGALSDKPVIGP